jgi:hypothetical protein
MLGPIMLDVDDLGHAVSLTFAAVPLNGTYPTTKMTPASTFLRAISSDKKDICEIDN